MTDLLARLRARGAAPDAAPRAPRTRFGAWLGRPMTSFHLIIAVTALLTTLAGRLAAVDELSGDGVPEVRARLRAVSA